jgi:HNH endonuclease
MIWIGSNMSVSNKLRFEVFKRDKFTCQYCGKKAPDVVLEADHIHPKSKGGEDTLLNLVTSCFSCNRGKKDRLLSDDSVISKQKTELELLQERRNQLEMLQEWAKELANIASLEVEVISEEFKSYSNCELTSTGKEQLRVLLSRYPFDEVRDTLKCVVQRLIDHDGKIETLKIQETVSRQIKWTRKNASDPDAGTYAYTGGIMKNGYRMGGTQWSEYKELSDSWKELGLNPFKFQNLAIKHSGGFRGNGDFPSFCADVLNEIVGSKEFAIKEGAESPCQKE